MVYYVVDISSSSIDCLYSFLVKSSIERGTKKGIEEAKTYLKPKGLFLCKEGENMARTDGLSGYAAAYKDALMSGKSDAQSHSAANNTIGGTGLTPSDVNKITTGNTVSNSFNVNPDTGYVESGYESRTPVTPPQPQFDTQAYLRQLEEARRSACYGAITKSHEMQHWVILQTRGRSSTCVLSKT